MVNEYKIKYEEKKDRILDLLNKTKKIYEDENKEYESNVFGELIENLKNEEFSIVLVGEFSAGKSTFLNALMGEKILPSFTDETTATVNFLRHKDKSENGEKGKVYFSDGQVQSLDEIDFNVINKYVCTKSDIRVSTSIDHFDLYLDSKFLEGNVTLVDSPGLNGTADGHREITEAQIAKSSASIFMFKADQPGSETDFKFLRQLKGRVNTIIFVLNKIDDIKISEGETPESVIKSLKDNYKKQFPEEVTIPEIWGISAYQALVARSNQKLDYRDRSDYSEEEKKLLEEKSRMKEFEDRLWKFLTQGEKARSILLSPIEKVINISKDSLDNMKSQIDILNNKEDTAEIEERILEVKKQSDNINEKIKEINSNINRRLSTLTNEIEDSFEVKAERLRESEVRKLEDWTDIDELLDFENTIIDRATKEFKKIANRCEKEFVEGINEIVEGNYIEIVDEVNSNLNKANFNINIDTIYNPSEVEYKLGIEKYNEEIRQSENILKEIQENLDNAQLSKIKIRGLERKKKNIEEKINNARLGKKYYEENLPPSKQYKTDTVIKHEKRNGLLGIFANILIGDKEIQTTENKITNEDEINEFKRIRDQNVKSYEDEIELLKKEKEKIEVNEENDEEIQFKIKKLMEKEKEIKLKIENMQNEYKEKYIKKNRSALLNKKREIEKYYDEITEQYLDSINRELRDKKKIFADMIGFTISNSLKIKLDNKNKEYQLLEEKLKTSEDKKNEYLNKLNKMSNELVKLIEEAVIIQSEIESQEINVIEEEIL